MVTIFTGAAHRSAKPLLYACRADRVAAPREAQTLVGVTIIDLDRTITRHGTYSPFLLFSARRLGLVPLVLLAMAAYKLRLIRRRTLREVMHRLMLGRVLDGKIAADLADAFADDMLARNLNTDAAALIARKLCIQRVCQTRRFADVGDRWRKLKGNGKGGAGFSLT